MTRAAIVVLSAGLCLAPGAPLRAQEPKVAGTDVPAPRRTKFVAPAYPVEAQMRGLRGIVLLELIVDEQGRVAPADVIRSVPPFDEAALSAAGQWEYEITQVDGRPVRVRVTVPITFALKLPEMTRAEGVPEMRQGAAPAFPPGLEGPARVVAELTLLADGSVAEASVRSGDSPWAEALLLALRTWRFAAAPQGIEVGFTVQADFVSPGRPGQPPTVELQLIEPRRRDVAAPPSPAAHSGHFAAATRRAVTGTRNTVITGAGAAARSPRSVREPGCASDRGHQRPRCGSPAAPPAAARVLRRARRLAGGRGAGPGQG